MDLIFNSIKPLFFQKIQFKSRLNLSTEHSLCEVNNKNWFFLMDQEGISSWNVFRCAAAAPPQANKWNYTEKKQVKTQKQHKNAHDVLNGFKF